MPRSVLWGENGQTECSLAGSAKHGFCQILAILNTEFYLAKKQFNPCQFVKTKFESLTKAKVHWCMTAKCWLVASWSPNTHRPLLLQSGENHAQNRITKENRPKENNTKVNDTEGIYYSLRSSSESLDRFGVTISDNKMKFRMIKSH